LPLARLALNSKSIEFFIKLNTPFAGGRSDFHTFRRKSQSRSAAEIG